MNKMKKHIAVAVTVALLAFPLSSAMANESTPDSPVMVATTALGTETTEAVAAEAPVAAYEAGPLTTLVEVATAEGLKAAADTAVAAGDEATKEAFELRITTRAAIIAAAKATLQLEAAVVAVAAYEGGPITTLAEVATAEGLKAAADTAVEALGDDTAKTDFELRVTTRATVIAAAKSTLQIAAAEVAVAAYEGGPITTLAEVATAEGLKAAANTAVAAVSNDTAKTDFELRITTRATAIATAKIALDVPVVDEDGNVVLPANWLSDLINKLQFILATTPERKCELNERHALAKLAQAQKMMKDGKHEAAQISIDQYTDKIAKAQAFLEQVEDPTSETAVTLDKALVNVNANNIVVLGNLLDKLPEQAAQKLALNVVRTMEKAVNKIEKEEAKADLETTPATTPTTTPVITPVDRKISEKQVKIALENFKKSLSQKGKIHIEGINQQDDEDKTVAEQSKQEQEKSTKEQKFVTQSQSNHGTVAPVNTPTTPTFRTSDKNKDDRNKQDDRNKDNDKDNDKDDNKDNGRDRK